MLTQQELILSVENTYKVGVDIIKKKNSDYATTKDALSNFKVIESLGVVDYKRGILVRVADKFARVVNLMDRPNVVLDESVEDTLIDMINYLAILKAGLENEREENEPFPPVMEDKKGTYV